MIAGHLAARNEASVNLDEANDLAWVSRAANELAAAQIWLDDSGTITILEIKSERIQDEAKVRNVRLELDELTVNSVFQVLKFF